MTQFITDIDIELPKALIEVTISPAGKSDKLAQLKSPELNPSGKRVILVAPHYDGPAIHRAGRLGALHVHSISELVALLQQLGE